MKKERFALCITFFVTLVSCVHFGENKATLAEVLVGFRLINSENSENRSVMTFEGDSSKKAILIILKQPFSEPEAEQMFLGKTQYVESMYQINYDPYYGKPDKDPGCMVHLNYKGTQKKEEKLNTLSFLLEANEQLVYGICPKKPNFYLSRLVYIYCPSKKIFMEIKTFWPSQDEPMKEMNYENLCAAASF